MISLASEAAVGLYSLLTASFCTRKFIIFIFIHLNVLKTTLSSQKNVYTKSYIIY